MKYNVPDRVMRDIAVFAKECSIQKVILFGSRARGFLPAFAVLEGTLRTKAEEAQDNWD